MLDADDAIAAFVATLGDEAGVDTEFMRVRTFHPIAALYQLAGEGGVGLVDAAAPISFAPLKALLQDAGRTKIMHSCSEDLEVMASHLGVRPRAVVDTQIAHAFLTPELSASYAALAERYVGVALDKQETRSDWLRRPLLPAQLTYARLDVVHLPAMWRAEREALEATGRLAWFEEEMRRVLAVPAETPETWYRNLKGVWRFDARQLAVLRSLVAWREREARNRNLPRAWTVPDDALLTMARWKRLTAQEVSAALPGRRGRRYAAALMEARQRGLDDPEPPSREPRPLGPRDNLIVKALREVVAGEASRLDMAAPLLATRRDLEAALRHHREHGELPEQFAGWRGILLGDKLRDTLANAR